MPSRPSSVWTSIAEGSRIDHAIFYCKLSDVSLLETLEFYSEDLRLLRELADEVTICTSLRSLVRARPGLLWAWWHSTSLPAIALWRLRRRSVVATGAVDLTNPVEPSTRHRIKRPLTKAAARLAHINLAISDYERSDLERLSPRLIARTLYPGVDCSYFRPAEPSHTPSVTVVAQVNGPSIHRKGLDRLIESFVEVRRRIPEARLVVVGPVKPDGVNWIESMRQASRLDGVEFAGFVDRERKRDLVASSWAYVQPSRYEGFGLAVAEAMACGVRPIVTDVGSLPEVVGSIGTVCDPNASALAESICDALKEKPTPDDQENVASEALRFTSASRTERFRRLIADVAAQQRWIRS